MAMITGMKGKTYLVTGAAGFIGFHAARRLLELGCRVIGLDNENDYYDVSLKQARLSILKGYDRFLYYKGDISDEPFLLWVFSEHRPDYVIHLAAQAGVRYSLTNPDVYMQSNIMGFFAVLEACRAFPVTHLVYASSSSVYGANEKVPFAEDDPVDHPVSLYAATKKSNELMADTYSHLYGIPATGLRFFTVYGPFGRPDMAYFSFTDAYFSGKEITIFNGGDREHDLYRDFTYIDDIVEGMLRLTHRPAVQRPLHQIFNIGNNSPVKLMRFIEILEHVIHVTTGNPVSFRKVYEPMKPEDVPATYASIERLKKYVGFQPKTTLPEGLQKFSDWYCSYYHKH